MSHSERARRRILRLKRHLEMPLDPDKRASLEAEYNRLVTGKQPKRPVGTTIGVKQTRRRK